MRFILGLAILGGAVLMSGCAVTYSYTSTASGSIGGVPFSNAQFAISAFANTDNSVVTASGFEVPHDSAIISIAGVGTFEILSPTRTLVDKTAMTAAFARGAGGTDLVRTPANAAFATWDTVVDLGPITGQGQILQWGSPVVSTTGGTLVLTDSTPAVTFQAFVQDDGNPVVTNYHLLSQTFGPRNQNTLTFSTDLANGYSDVGSAIATPSNLDPFHVRGFPGQNTPTFPSAGSGGVVHAKNTFTLIVDNTVPLNLAKLQFTFETTPSPAKAVAGPNQIVSVGSTVMLNAESSTGPGTLSYYWKLVSRPPGTTTKLFYTDSLHPVFLADVPGVYVLSLTVSNGVSASTAFVTVTAQ